MRLSLGGISAIVGAVCGALPVAAEPIFMGLGYLPGGGGDGVGVNVGSFAAAISSDGTTVVGSSSTATSSHVATRWILGGQAPQIENIGAVPGVASLAFGVSANGSVVVGNAFGFPGGTIGAGSVQMQEAFRWTPSTGLVGLGYLSTLPGVPLQSSANAVSGNGSLVFGTSVSSLGSGGPSISEQFRWNAATNTMSGLGAQFPAGSVGSSVRAASADGSVIVGSTNLGPVGPFGSTAIQAYRLSETGGYTALNYLPGGVPVSEALSVSPDGTFIVGYSNRTLDFREATRWTQGGGVIGLGDLPGGASYSVASGVSANGSTIVGYSGGASGDAAFIWTDTLGMRDLKTVLTNDFHISIDPGWSLNGAPGISADGKTIVGTGTNPQGKTEAWVARLDFLPTPPTPQAAALQAFDLAKNLFAPFAPLTINGQQVQAQIDAINDFRQKSAQFAATQPTHVVNVNWSDVPSALALLGCAGALAIDPAALPILTSCLGPAVNLLSADELTPFVGLLACATAFQSSGVASGLKILGCIQSLDMLINGTETRYEINPFFQEFDLSFSVNFYSEDLPSIHAGDIFTTNYPIFGLDPCFCIMRITDVSNNGNTWRYDFTLDGFENTTVNEPSSIAMLAISVLMLVVALRTRARKELKQITRG